MKSFMSTTTVAAGLLLSGTALAQNGLPVGIDLAAGFTTVRGNAQPGACGCFFMSGGSAETAVNAPSGVALLFNFGETSISNINGGGHDLRLTTYLAGARYSYHSGSRFTPFAQVLGGIAHSSTNFVIDHASTAGAFAAGGGIDYGVSRRISLRLIQGEYLWTHIPNGVNDEQNQLRLTAGALFHLASLKRAGH